jgi:hypothetical protein
MTQHKRDTLALLLQAYGGFPLLIITESLTSQGVEGVGERVLSVYGPAWQEITGGCWELHNEYDRRCGLVV